MSDDLTSPKPAARLHRRQQILPMLRSGLSEKEIADELQLAVNTVHSHVKVIYRELGIHSRAQLKKLFAGSAGDRNDLVRVAVWLPREVHAAIEAMFGDASQWLSGVARHAAASNTNVAPRENQVPLN